MTTIDFRRIFRIGDDKILYDGGEILYKTLIEKDGFHGEERFSNGEFEVILYSTEDYCVKFPTTAFNKNEFAIQNARAKLGSFTLFLNERGVKVKMLGKS